MDRSVHKKSDGGMLSYLGVDGWYCSREDTFEVSIHLISLMVVLAENMVLIVGLYNFLCGSITGVGWGETWILGGYK